MNDIATIEPEAIALALPSFIAKMTGICDKKRADGMLATSSPALTTTRGNRAMANTPILSPDDLRQLLRYDPETGKLYWLYRPVEMFASPKHAFRSWNTRNAGKEAFTALTSWGYLHGSIMGKSYQAHRVAWTLVHGHWPTGEIDHINGNRRDNRLVNLRDVTILENRRNQSRSTKNTSGVTGIHWCNTWNRWIAKVMVGKKSTTIGNYATFEEAVAARAKANLEIGFFPGHGKERIG